MTNFNFMSLLFIMLIVRNGILILAGICTLINIKIELNLVSRELNFKLFLLSILHIIFYYTIDMDKVNENKLIFIFLMILLSILVKYIKINIDMASKYLYEKNNKENSSKTE